MQTFTCRHEMHLQQTKRESRSSGGPQYYFHDLTESAKIFLRKKGAVRVALVTPYGATKSDYFAVSKDHKLDRHLRPVSGSVGHDRIQQGSALGSIGESIRSWYKLSDGDFERIDVDIEIRDDVFYLTHLRDICQSRLDAVTKAGEEGLAELWESALLPPNLPLPSNSDVPHYRDLFTPRQLISLAILKNEIESLRDTHAKQAMLLAWSATLGKLNRTFLSATGRSQSRGGSSIFSIYRYKVAKELVELPAWKTFEERAMNILEAKSEIDRIITLKKKTNGWHGKFEAHSLDIEELSDQLKGTVDYVFTDPPYGGHISYLDLSTLWNCWLGILPSESAWQKELIVGGELKHSEEYYIKRLGESIRACLRMLKPDRWMSVVFQHWSTEYFEAILSSAAEEGAELKAAISQVGDPIWSMHKKKNKESVLAGEMILTFHKNGVKQAMRKSNSFDFAGMLEGTLSAHSPDKVYGEYLFNKLVIEAWNHSAIRSLNISRQEFADLMKTLGWWYDEKKHYWSRKNRMPVSLFETA